MKTSQVVFGVAVGVAVGAVLGILFAPDKGSNTRTRIAKKGEDFVGDIKERANHLAEVVRQPFHTDEMHEANGKASKMKYTEMK